MIPLTNNLGARGVTVNPKVCKFCLRDDENVDHVFFRCDYALTVWNWLANWSGLLATTPIDFNSFMICATFFKSDDRRLKLLLSLGYSVLWLIWKEINERFFGKRTRKPMQLADGIQLYSYNWINNRCKFFKKGWIDWCASPNGT
ncbi:hypothetical protein LXL04_031086 [Taraxacum kok-saghyz]